MSDSTGVSLRDSGVCSAQGGRPTHEDRYVVVLPDNLPSPSDKKQAFFAVYDGHGSKEAAEHVAENLHKLFIGSPTFNDGEYEEAVKAALAEEDSILLKEFRQGSNEFAFCGSTVALCFLDLTNGTLIAANVGDSEIILAECNLKTGQASKHQRLTRSHDPTVPSERKRIEKAGGQVHAARIGTLNMSRTLGDLQYKNPVNQSNSDASFPARKMTTTAIPEDRGDMVSNIPYITRETLEPGRHYALSLVTDGVTDELDDWEIIDKTVRAAAEEGLSANEVSGRIVKKSTEHPQSDNATCITVFLES